MFLFFNCLFTYLNYRKLLYFYLNINYKYKNCNNIMLIIIQILYFMK